MGKLTDIEEQLTVVLREKEKLFDELRSENSRLIETEEQLTVVTNEKNQLEFELNDATEKLDGEAHSAKTFLERNHKKKKSMNRLPDSMPTANPSQNSKEKNRLETDRS